MKLKEIHNDVERYLEEDCYCPNEVYSVDGFFYQLVYAGAEAEILGEYQRGNDEKVFLVATENSDKKPILLNIWCDDKKVDNMERYELTENNIHQLKAFWKGEIKANEIHLSEMSRIKDDLKQMMSIADAVMID